MCECATVTREGRRIALQSSVISKSALNLAHTPTYTRKSCNLNTAFLCHAVYNMEITN